MARGGPSFFVGPMVLQLPEALDMFVRTASAGTEFVYCEATSPQYGETWSRAGELAREGLVRTHERRRAGGGKQYYLVRTSKPLQRQRDPQSSALADRATGAIYRALKRAANMAQPCPSDTDLAGIAGLGTRDQAQWRVRKLVEVRLIGSTLAYEGGIPSRVVTIEPSKHAGASAGKFTALPKKWAALQRAAEGEQRCSMSGQSNPTAAAGGRR